jgi:hypothetical protein
MIKSKLYRYKMMPVQREISIFGSAITILSIVQTFIFNKLQESWNTYC